LQSLAWLIFFANTTQCEEEQEEITGEKKMCEDWRENGRDLREELHAVIACELL